MLQLMAPGQLLIIFRDDAASGEDAKELDRQRQRPAPLPDRQHTLLFLTQCQAQINLSTYSMHAHLAKASMQRKPE